MAKWASSIFTRYFFAIIVTLYPPADRVRAPASASDLTRCSNCRNASDRGRLHWVVRLRDLGLTVRSPGLHAWPPVASRAGNRSSLKTRRRLLISNSPGSAALLCSLKSNICVRTESFPLGERFVKKMRFLAGVHGFTVILQAPI